MGDMQTNATPGTATTAVPQWTFADRLRKARTDAGYDQRTFAQLLGVKAPTFSAYESGRVTPRYKDIGGFAARVEDLTGVPAWWLLDLAEAPEARPLRVVDLDSRRPSPVEDILHARTAPAPVRDAIVTAISDRKGNL